MILEVDLRTTVSSHFYWNHKKFAVSSTSFFRADPFLFGDFVEFPGLVCRRLGLVRFLEHFNF